MSNMKLEHEGYGQFQKAKITRYGKEPVYFTEGELLQLRDYLTDARAEGITFTALRKEVLAGRRQANSHHEHMQREAELRDQQRREKETQQAYEQAQAELAEAKKKAAERAKATKAKEEKADPWQGLKRYRQEVKEEYGHLEERKTALQQQQDEIDRMKAEAEKLNNE